MARRVKLRLTGRIGALGSERDAALARAEAAEREAREARYLHDLRLGLDATAAPESESDR